MELQIETLMEQLVEKGGSDLHLSAGLPPYGRFSGALKPMHDAPLAEENCFGGDGSASKTGSSRRS